ncbi:hypothetical protein Hanom_Chr05g00404171 [Helianthus anomalus]
MIFTMCELTSKSSSANLILLFYTELSRQQHLVYQVMPWRCLNYYTSYFGYILAGILHISGT